MMVLLKTMHMSCYRHEQVVWGNLKDAWDVLEVNAMSLDGGCMEYILRLVAMWHLYFFF